MMKICSKCHLLRSPDQYNRYYNNNEFKIKAFNICVFCMDEGRESLENYIRENINGATPIDWAAVCSLSTLSEDFIQEFSDKVDWQCISYYQILSKEFVFKNYEKINWKYCQYLIDKTLPQCVKLHISLNYRGLIRKLQR